MFSNLGGVEILIILCVIFLIIGPDRLPGLIKEVRSILMAIKLVIQQAREQIDGEFGNELREFSQPLQQLNSVRQMGARGFITKTLLDGDDTVINTVEGAARDLKTTANTFRAPTLRTIAQATAPNQPGTTPTAATPNPAAPTGGLTDAGSAPTAPAAAGAQAPTPQPAPPVVHTQPAAAPGQGATSGSQPSAPAAPTAGETPAAPTTSNTGMWDDVT